MTLGQRLKRIVEEFRAPVICVQPSPRPAQIERVQRRAEVKRLMRGMP